MIDSKLFNHLADRSTRQSYNVRTLFDWPDKIPEDQWWLPRNLLSIDGTEWAKSVDDDKLRKLSHYETINLFSLFVQGEADLLQTILAIMVRDEFLDGFDYFSHFVEEENQHMWFFAEFCRRYGGKNMPIKMIKFTTHFPPAVDTFLAISRIFLFEEMGDWFNFRTMKHEGIPDLIQQIHRRHHLDEAGHIAAGWSVATAIWQQLVEKEEHEVLQQAITHLSGFIDWSVQNLYNPEAYKRAGFDSPYEMREELLNNPARKSVHNEIFKKARNRFKKIIGPDFDGFEAK